MVLKKRKRGAVGGLAAAAKATRRRKGAGGGAEDGEAGAATHRGDDGLLESDAEASTSEEDLNGQRKRKAEDDDEEEAETPEEKRVRLAKEYVGRLGADKDKEETQDQLAQDVEDHALRSKLRVTDLSLGEPRFLKQGHSYPLTCVSLSADDTTAWTGGKDCSIVRWDVETGQRAYLLGGRNRFDCGGHFQQVFSVCPAESRSLLFSGGGDRVVRMWDLRAPSKSTCSNTLQGHSAAVTGISAEADGTQLYTASWDKSLRLWDLRMLRSLDTLFGHVAGINCMDAFYKGRPVTGGADKTVRLWKVEKETHLMYSRHSYSVDAVTVAEQDRFLSGSQDGLLQLWSPSSKKPVATASLGSSCWISALKAIRRSNVVFSGCATGKLRCWRFGRQAEEDSESSKAGVQLTEALPCRELPGCVNDVAVGRKVLACAIGKEHRLGRWNYDKSKKNGLMLFPLSYHEG